MNNKSIISLIKELKTFLKEKRKLSYEDPSINPVSSLAHLLSRKFVNNEINLPKINSIIEHLSQELIFQRASNLNKNSSFKIKKVISKITKDNNLQNFKAFEKFWSSNKIGSVFTAHPTFNLNDEAWNNIVIAGQLIKQKKQFPSIKQRSISKIKLVDEHNSVINAIHNFWNAVNEVNKEVLNLGQKKWPAEFRIFIPSIIYCASWVGYDLDGRADINWIDSFYFRLKEKSLMLERFEIQIKNLFKYKYEKIYNELNLILKKIELLKLNTFEFITLIKSNDLNKLSDFEENFEKIKDQSFNSKLRESIFITMMPKKITTTATQILMLTNSLKNIQLSRIAIIISILLTKTNRVGEAKLKAWQMA